MQPGGYVYDGYPYYPVYGSFDFDYGGWGGWHHGWDHSHWDHGGWGPVCGGHSAASAGMAAEATAKSLFENFLSLHAGEEFSNGLPGPDWAQKKHIRAFGRAAQAARIGLPGQAEPDTRQCAA